MTSTPTPLLQAVFASVLLAAWTPSAAWALPQYQRLIRQEYGFKAPCATCHAQGGGSSLSVYGKAFERAGKSRGALASIASIVPKGDTFDFGTKLKARADPNDPTSTPKAPGTWAGKGDIPSDELKTFVPSDATAFSILEGELSASQIDALKAKVGASFQEEDKSPTFYFAEVAGKKTYVVQYVHLPSSKRTLGLVVSTKGQISSLVFVGAKAGPVSAKASNTFVGKKLSEVESTTGLTGEEAEVGEGVRRGLNVISLVFASKTESKN
ncbi:MAG: hypothetical protein IOD12_09955 [Silvanigrellales bacterium]|jgi:hypothetical protein|nr:hypothetical protein [Silvanigrellales bacterium]